MVFPNEACFVSEIQKHYMKYTKKFTAVLKPSCYTFTFNWLESHVNSTEASDLILSQSQNNFIEVFIEHDFIFFFFEEKQLFPLLET